MSIASEIQRIKGNIEDAYTECENKGATLPQNQNSDNLATTIASISGGGGADLSEYFKTDYTSLGSETTSFTQTLLKKLPPINLASNVKSMENAFRSWGNRSAALSNLDCQNITTMQNMFAYSNWFDLDISKLQNTGNVKNMQSMFESASIYKNFLNYGSLNTSGATNMSYMFQRATFYTNDGATYIDLDLTNWDKSKVSNMTSMFSYTNVNKIKINSSNSLTQMSGMFSSCRATEIDISGMNTTNVTTMQSTFNSLTNVVSLDASSFTALDNVRISNMFAYSHKLAVIDVSNFEFSKSHTSYRASVFNQCGDQCLQSDGAYANGIPYVYVKDATEQSTVLGLSGTPSTWSTNNVVIKSN